MLKIKDWVKALACWLKMQSLERLALAITLIYIFAYSVIIIVRIGELFSLNLNELGDFSAGIFAPLAFLWLVLGYRQQGQELRESSKALQAQCEALMKSVMLQVEANALPDKMNDPILSFICIGQNPENNNLGVFQIINEKNSCFEVTIDVDAVWGKPSSGGQVVGTLLEGGCETYYARKSTVEFPSFLVSINYTRITGSKGSQLFRVFGPAPGVMSISSVMRIPKEWTQSDSSAV